MSVAFDSETFSDRTEFNLNGVLNSFKVNGNVVKRSCDDFDVSIVGTNVDDDSVVIRGRLNGSDESGSLTVDVNNQRQFELTTNGQGCTIEARNILAKYGFKYTGSYEKDLTGEVIRYVPSKDLQEVTRTNQESCFLMRLLCQVTKSFFLLPYLALTLVCC